jgi:hypothetical protein
MKSVSDTAMQGNMKDSQIDATKKYLNIYVK